MKNKSSLTITIADDIRRRLEQAAQDDRRSLSSMVEVIMLESGRLDKYYNPLADERN